MAWRAKIVVAPVLGLAACLGASAVSPCLDNTTSTYNCQANTLGLLNLVFCDISDEDVEGGYLSSCFEAAERTNISHLALGHNDITVLPEDIFQGLDALLELGLYGNDLTTLPAGLFRNLTTLESISLHDNNLTILPEGLFDNLTTLQSIDLENNTLASLPNGLFQNLPALETLDLDYNDLLTLPEGIFYNTTALEWLDLNNNRLTTLPEGTFQGLNALDDLLLGSNNLTNLPEGLFQGLTALQTLELANNNLTSLPEGLFQGLPALQILNLDNNQLLTLPEGVFYNTTALESLDLANNQLPTLPEEIFYNLTTLENLRLDKNRFTTLPEGTFQGLDALENLYLNESDIASLPERIFQGLSDLSALYLGSNQLTTLPEAVFHNLTDLTSLYLGSNQLTTLPEAVFHNLTDLTSLDLSDNVLTTLPEAIFSGLPALDYLNLTGNVLQCLPNSTVLEETDGIISSDSKVYVDLYGDFCGCSVPEVTDNVCGEEACIPGPAGYNCVTAPSSKAPVGAIVGGVVGLALVVFGLILAALFKTGRIKPLKHGRSRAAAAAVGSAGSAPLSGEGIGGSKQTSSPSTTTVVTEGTMSQMRTAPGFGSAVEQAVTEADGLPPGVSRDYANLTAPRAACLPDNKRSGQAPIEGNEIARGMWPPSTVVKDDRRKATAMWMLLLAAFISYVVYIGLNSMEMRENPPVKLLRKEEPFNLPDVVICPSAGDGCNGSYGSDCLPMDWFLSAVQGLSGCEEYFATPSPTPAPAADDAATPAPTGGVAGDYEPIPTPAPVVRPAIRYSLETTAHEWCPRVPLSQCAVDSEGVETGDVRSLHVSFYVLWDDTVIADPVLSTRRFINMFFVEEDMEVADAVVAGRLPYDRVNITGTDPFTFSSNDVVLGMSQYVPLGSGGDLGLVERTYTQATTTSQHTLVLETFEGEEYEGALLYVTLSVNNFAYQSIEEIDPVDWWALLGSAGGVWEIICVIFGACFVARQAIGPDKQWGWAMLGSNGERGRCSSCMK